MSQIKLNLTAKCNVCSKKVRISWPKENALEKRMMVCPACDMIRPHVPAEDVGDTAK